MTFYSESISVAAAAVGAAPSSMVGICYQTEVLRELGDLRSKAGLVPKSRISIDGQTDSVVRSKVQIISQEQEGN